MLLRETQVAEQKNCIHVQYDSTNDLPSQRKAVHLVESVSSASAPCIGKTCSIHVYRHGIADKNSRMVEAGTVGIFGGRRISSVETVEKARHLRFDRFRSNGIFREFQGAMRWNSAPGAAFGPIALGGCGRMPVGAMASHRAISLLRGNHQTRRAAKAAPCGRRVLTGAPQTAKVRLARIGSAVDKRPAAAGRAPSPPTTGA